MTAKFSLDKHGSISMNVVTCMAILGAGWTANNKLAEIATMEYVDAAVSEHTVSGVHPAAQALIIAHDTELLAVNKSLDYLAERAAREDVEELQALVCADPDNTALKNELNDALSIYREITGNGFPPSELGCN